MKSNTDDWPTDGASLWEALQLVTSEQELDGLYSCDPDADRGFPGLTIRNVDGEDGWVELKPDLWVSSGPPWDEVTQQFREKLIAGALKAEGYVEPLGITDEPQAIPPEKWRLLDFDFARSAAKGSGLSIVGIKVWPAGAEADMIKSDLEIWSGGKTWVDAEYDELGESAPDPYRTGMPGRPTIGHLIQQEFQRRIDAGEIEPSLAAQARQLRSWVMEQHPAAPAPTAHTIENQIRDAYRKAHHQNPTK